MREEELIGSLARKAGNTLLKHFGQDWALLKERSTAKEAAIKGVLLVQEAGGKVSDFQGNPWKPQTNGLLLSNKKLHEKILSLISSQ
jgi:hypothetical protein